MKYIATDQAPQAIGPYAQAVKVNGMIYTSGQIPMETTGQIPMETTGEITTSTIEEQTHQVFANLKAVLAEAGSSLGQVVKATVFIQDMNEFGALNDVYAHHFGDHTPARSTVEVARLPKDAKVEIEVVAVAAQ